MGRSQYRDTKTITKEEVVRAARLCSSNSFADEALGIVPGAFGRLCNKFNIESPLQREKDRSKRIAKRKRERKERESA